MEKEIYAYAAGRVRAMETRLLDRSKIDRMVEASSAEEALKVFGESQYAEYISGLNSIFDFETMLQQEMRRVFLELRQFSPEPELVSLFACKYDYHNLKVLFKAQRLGQEAGELLVKDVGNVPLSTLIPSVAGDDYKSLPRPMREAARSLSEALRLEFNPQMVDLLLDQAMFSEMAELAEKLGSAFIQEYLACLIDLINIKTYLRIQRAGGSRDFLEKALVRSGKIDMTKLVQLGDPLEVLSDRLLSTSYAGFIEESIQAYLKTGTLTRFEKLADDFLINHAKKAKYISFGPEPLAAFILAKENEVKLIRIILVGKINRLPVEELKERLRDVYV